MDLASLERVGEWLRVGSAAAISVCDRSRRWQRRASESLPPSVPRCHAPNGERMGQVIPIDEIGTDRHRLDTWTESSAAAFNATPSGAAWPFKGFRKTNGYVAMPLVGTWLNAPYLHNGSVPTLADLLNPPDQRPTRFYRGYDVIDPVGVGFVADDSAARDGELYETNTTRQWRRWSSLWHRALPCGQESVDRVSENALAIARAIEVWHGAVCI